MCVFILYLTKSWVSNIVNQLSIKTIYQHFLTSLGTIFSGGWIHICLSSECLWQQVGVCGTEPKQTTLCVFMVMKKHVNQCNSADHVCVFNIFKNNRALWHRWIWKENSPLCTYNEVKTTRCLFHYINLNCDTTQRVSTF